MQTYLAQVAESAVAILSFTTSFVSNFSWTNIWFLQFPGNDYNREKRAMLDNYKGN